MKYVIEFGNRGGAHTDNLILNTSDAAKKLAASLVMVFCNDPHAGGALLTDWTFEKHCKRKTWVNKSHFVAVSILDGKPRGAASNGIWRKPIGEELLSGTVSSHY